MMIATPEAATNEHSVKACCHTKAAEPPIETARVSTPIWVTYKPLIVIAAVALLAGILAALPYASINEAMRVSMGVFLTILATLKLLDVSGFAKTFQRYDPIAARFPPYALAYPYIEAALGLLILTGVAVGAASLVLIPILAFTTVGIIEQLNRGVDLNCGCTGTVTLPLGRVSVAENLIMIAMAGAMLVM
jgi:uncharacterized membrane protein YphA (DoxX/SURF4 family)